MAFIKSPPVNLGFTKKRRVLDTEREKRFLEKREFERPLENERPLFLENERPLERPLLFIAFCLFFLKVFVTAKASL